MVQGSCTLSFQERILKVKPLCSNGPSVRTVVYKNFPGRKTEFIYDFLL